MDKACLPRVSAQTRASQRGTRGPDRSWHRCKERSQPPSLATGVCVDRPCTLVAIALGPSREPVCFVQQAIREDTPFFLQQMASAKDYRKMAHLVTASCARGASPRRDVSGMGITICNGLQLKWLRTAINGNVGPDYLHLSIPSGRDYVPLRLLVSN